MNLTLEQINAATSGEVARAARRHLGATSVDRGAGCEHRGVVFTLEETLRAPAALKGGVELLFTYDKEYGGDLGPGWLLAHRITKPDLLIAAGFSYQVLTAHTGCLQMEVTVHGHMAHAAVPDTGVDALQGATAVLNALYAENRRYKSTTSAVTGITHLPQRRAHRGRNQHERGSGQGRAEVRPQDDS